MQTFQGILFTHELRDPLSVHLCLCEGECVSVGIDDRSHKPIVGLDQSFCRRVSSVDQLQEIHDNDHSFMICYVENLLNYSPFILKIC